MKYPTFAHGKMVNIQKAIADGKIQYPSYIWCTDLDVYCFLNKDGELEQCGIPQLTGTLENEIILSSLDDGLYEVKGRHKITASHATTFDCSGFILVVVQTIGGVKKVRRITADELSVYTIQEDLTVSVDEVATKDYLDEKGYTTEEQLDEKIAVLKAELEDEIEAALPSMIEPLVYPVVEEVVDRMIQPEDDQNIRDLFNE